MLFNETIYIFWLYNTKSSTLLSIAETLIQKLICMTENIVNIKTFAEIFILCWSKYIPKHRHPAADTDLVRGTFCTYRKNMN